MLCCGSTKILFPVIIYKKKTFKKDIQNKKMSTIPNNSFDLNKKISLYLVIYIYS